MCVILGVYKYMFVTIHPTASSPWSEVHTTCWSAVGRRSFLSVWVIHMCNVIRLYSWTNSQINPWVHNNFITLCNISVSPIYRTFFRHTMLETLYKTYHSKTYLTIHLRIPSYNVPAKKHVQCSVCIALFPGLPSIQFLHVFKFCALSVCNAAISVMLHCPQSRL